MPKITLITTTDTDGSSALALNITGVPGSPSHDEAVQIEDQVVAILGTVLEPSKPVPELLKLKIGKASIEKLEIEF